MGSFVTIKAEVLERLGGRTNIDSRVEIWINDAYFDLLMRPQFRFHQLDKELFLETDPLVARYDLDDKAPTIWFILGMRNEEDQREIRARDWKTFDRVATSYGSPIRYMRFNSIITFDPVPDKTYTIKIRYRNRPAEISTGEPLILEREWEEVLTALSVVKGYLALEEPTKAASALQLYNSLLQAREEVLIREEEDIEASISPVLGW